MARNTVPERRTGDRRVRPVYHDLDRRSSSERRATEASVAVRDTSQSPGPIMWTVIVLTTLFAADAILWHGQYRQALWMSFTFDGAGIRAWSEDLWRPAAT